MFGRRDLSTRADRVVLPASQDASWFDVLYSEGNDDQWRIVELSSLNGRPFDAEIHWSAANGAGAKALVTVSHAGRVSVFARTVKVRIRNLFAMKNAVGVTIADGFAETRNQYEVRGSAKQGHPFAIRVPPFARTARFEVLEPDDASATAWVVDGDGRRVSTTRLSDQPPEGLAVGGASELWFWTDQPNGQRFRCVFHLNL